MGMLSSLMSKIPTKGSALDAMNGGVKGGSPGGIFGAVQRAGQEAAAKAAAAKAAAVKTPVPPQPILRPQPTPPVAVVKPAAGVSPLATAGRPMRKGGTTKMAKGGSASSRGDGIAQRGKTRGKMV